MSVSADQSGTGTDAGSARRRAWLRPVAVVVIVAAGFLAACGGSSGTRLGATLREFRVSMDHSSVAAGKLRLTVTNRGTVQHELVAFKTDLAVDALPMAGDHVDEHGAGITHIDPEAEDVNPGTAKTVTLDLEPGRYVFLCNIATHYAQGMRAVVTVS